MPHGSFKVSNLLVVLKPDGMDKMSNFSSDNISQFGQSHGTLENSPFRSRGITVRGFSIIATTFRGPVAISKYTLNDPVDILQHTTKNGMVTLRFDGLEPPAHADNNVIKTVDGPLSQFGPGLSVVDHLQKSHPLATLRL
jgi:hypothetical protein